MNKFDKIPILDEYDIPAHVMYRSGRFYYTIDLEVSIAFSLQYDIHDLRWFDLLEVAGKYEKYIHLPVIDRNCYFVIPTRNDVITLFKQEMTTMYEQSKISSDQYEFCNRLAVNLYSGDDLKTACTKVSK